MAKETISAFPRRWSKFMMRAGLAAAALGMLMLAARINAAIALYFIFGGAASWLGGKALD